MPSADRSTGKKVAVIGAGTVGSSCAWHLQKHGYQVVLLDPVDPGQSTSFGNAACISPSHITPFSYPGVVKQIPGWLMDPLGPLRIRWQHLPGLLPWLWRFWRSGTDAGVAWSSQAQARLMREVHADWDEILEATGQSHMRRHKGVIVVFDQRAEFEAAAWQYRIKDELGFEWQHLAPSEVKIMAPALELGNGMALYYPDWQHVLDPGEVTAGIARDCMARGGQWLQDRVLKVEANEQQVNLQTESGQQLTADSLVVAAGSWSNRICGQLDYTVPLAAKRGYHSMIGSPGIELEYPVMSMTRSFVMTPLQNGLRVAGTAELARLDAEPDYRRAKVLLRHAQHYFPGLQSEQVSEWMGQRPMMADSVPVISCSPTRRNVFYAFGHGHYGLTQGPTTGKAITRLISGEEPSVDIRDYRFERFRS
ncbi:MAG: FAD-binding oxidoreductase [Xanthomonadales bacterium]|nr:FAD-binding oxidoreductase [Xanthomonadales bacterium]